MHRRVFSLLTVMSVLLFGAASGAVAYGGGGSHGYRVNRLVSDQAGEAPVRDQHLVNAWGLVAGPDTPWWVADADSNFSPLYDGTGAIVPLVVRVFGGPTGTVFNGGSGFVVKHGGEMGPSAFMFATESGTIRGWNPGVVPPPPSKKAYLLINRAGQDANFKGLAIATTGGRDYIYATDFHNGRVDVFRDDLHQMHWAGAFVDPHIPGGYAPFGIQRIRDRIFVTYAKQDADAEDEVAGKSLGFVDAFGLQGRFLGRVASRGVLDAPWGLAWAPSNFGRFSGDLLVGNFGNGRVNAYHEGPDGHFEHVALMRHPNGTLVRIDGLWALEFGNGGPAGPTNQLYFTAGPDEETHGSFGNIEAA
jgi:uncharacterized protein (TIGR03118 family)